MKDQLEDWQLALLIEAKRYDDPTVIEAAKKEQYGKREEFLDELDTFDDPVIVERPVAEAFNRYRELLEEADGFTEPGLHEVPEQESLKADVEAMDELLSKPLRENLGLRDSVIAEMSVRAKVAQFEDDDGEIQPLEALVQNPETGGAPPDDGADGDGTEGAEGESGDGPDFDEIPADDRKEAREKLSTAETMADRTPKYAESLRSEAAALLGVDDWADIDMEVL